MSEQQYSAELFDSCGRAVLLGVPTSFLLFFFLPIKGEKCCHMTLFRENHKMRIGGRLFR